MVRGSQYFFWVGFCEIKVIFQRDSYFDPKNPPLATSLHIQGGGVDLGVKVPPLNEIFFKLLKNTA